MKNVLCRMFIVSLEHSATSGLTVTFDAFRFVTLS